MPATIMVPWVRLMTSMTPQIRVSPMAARPYTSPTSTPSIIEARIPSIDVESSSRHAMAPARTSRLVTCRDRIDHRRGLGISRPDHLASGLAILLLPLRQHHLVRGLQPMVTRIISKLDASEECCDIGAVQRRRHLISVDGIGLLDSVLQNHAGRIARRGVIVGLGVEFLLERFGKLRGGRPELRLVIDLRLPL